MVFSSSTTQSKSPARLVSLLLPLLTGFCFLQNECCDAQEHFLGPAPIALASQKNVCVDVAIRSEFEGSLVVPWECNGDSNQLFSLVALQGGDKFLIRAYHSDKCIEAGNKNDDMVTQTTCVYGETKTQWKITGARGQQKIESVGVPGLCLSKGASVFTLGLISVRKCEEDDDLMIWHVFAMEAVPDSISIAGAIVLEQDSDKCVDVANSDRDNDAAVQEHECNGTGAQQFRFAEFDNGYYQIRPQHSNKCLAVDGTRDNYAVLQVTCQAGDALLWKPLDSEGRNPRRLQNKASGKCMRVNSGFDFFETFFFFLFTVHDKMVQGSCDDNSDEALFRIFPLEPLAISETGSSAIVLSEGDNYCVDVRESNKKDGADVAEWECNESGAQQFRVAMFDGGYQLRSEHSDKCLGVATGTLNSNRVVQLSCGANDQRLLWEITGSGSDRKIMNKESGQCLQPEEATLTSDLFGLFGVRETFVVVDDCGNADASLKFDAFDWDGRNPWIGPFNTGVIAASAASLPDGKVLIWSSYQRMEVTSSSGRTFTGIFDPVSGRTNDLLVKNIEHDMFCPGTTFLADGRLMITGGDNNDRTTFYDPISQVWEKGPALKIPRGYQTSTIMADGSVFMLGGSWEEQDSTGGKDGELWSPVTGEWRLLPGVLALPMQTNDSLGPYRSDNHMFLFQAPNGYIFQAGPSKLMHWIDTAGDGRVWPSILRGDSDDCMTATATMFDVGKILVTGGAKDYDESDAFVESYVIDINADEAVVTKVGDMFKPRGMHNAAVLPSGEVVVTGGVEFADIFSDVKSVLMAEIWNPSTGQFTTIPTPMQIPRNYHSTSLLLQDGRIFAAGGGVCGDCEENHPDAEILTPPYLYDADGFTLATRPVIVSAPTTIELGQTISVTMDSDAAQQFALVRTGSVTHSVNTDQRRVPLTSVVQTGATHSITIPSNKHVVQPGHYYLFAMNAGVPSIATTVYKAPSP